jgi:hypothetical protein
MVDEATRRRYAGSTSSIRASDSCSDATVTRSHVKPDITYFFANSARLSYRLCSLASDALANLQFNAE